MLMEIYRMTRSLIHKKADEKDGFIISFLDIQDKACVQNFTYIPLKSRTALIIAAMFSFGVFA